MGYERLLTVRASIEQHIKGKPDVVELALVSLVAGGHLLLEDVPGVGKTSLARALAQSLGLSWSRIQFTPDLLPADITGVSIYDPERRTFEFRPGPVFASVVVADEINRATPRTQAALLEAMEEGSVTTDGVTRGLPRPFFVVATQNPIEMTGTFPLPEAQVDRFMIRTSLGYPDFQSEFEVVSGAHEGRSIADIDAVITQEDAREFVLAASRVFVAPEVVRYLVGLVSWTRSAKGVALGASPRASVNLLRAAKARAFLHGRPWVGPGDIQALITPVLAHRIVVSAEGESGGVTPVEILSQAIKTVPAPQPE